MSTASDSDGGESGMTFEDVEETYVHEGEEEGDDFLKATLTRVENHDTDETNLQLYLKEGVVQEQDLAGKDESVLVEPIFGNSEIPVEPEKLGDVIEALQDLEDQIPL